MVDRHDELSVPVRFDFGAAERDLGRMQALGEQFARTMSRAFQDAAFSGKGFGDVLKGLALQLSKLALQSALKPLEQGFGSIFSKLFAGLSPFAKGGVLGRGAPVPFAQGGVVAAPTYFPMRGGRLGLMGERGAEAILPLARGADGRLGVRSAGSGATTINMNIATPDVESFRRSQGQVAAMLSRTVARGQRNL